MKDEVLGGLNIKVFPRLYGKC